MWIILSKASFNTQQQCYIHSMLSSRKRVMFTCSDTSAAPASSFSTLSRVHVQPGQGHPFTFTIWRMSLYVWLVEVECPSMCGVMLVPFWGLGRPSLCMLRCAVRLVELIILLAHQCMYVYMYMYMYMYMCSEMVLLEWCRRSAS